LSRGARSGIQLFESFIRVHGRVALAPRRLIHGHPPLTRVFTIEALAGLQPAMQALYQHVVESAQAARPLADLLHDDFIPEQLRSAPQSVMAYLVARDLFAQRAYAENAGYWKSKPMASIRSRAASGEAR
jgi:hypothetical protein